MATSSFPSVVTGVTVETATAGALSGDGSSGNKLAVGVDGTTVNVNGSNQLEALGAAVAFKTIAVSGQSNIVADAADDTLTIVAGSNITLTTNAGTDTLTIAASGGGGGSPGGSNTQVQFNDSTAFGGDSGLTYDKTTDTLTAGVAYTVPQRPPQNPSATPGTAGSLAAGDYFVVVTALDAVGETLASDEVPATIAGPDDGTGSLDVSADAVAFASSYNVYIGTTTGGEDQFFNVSDFSVPLTITDLSGDPGTPPTVATFYGIVLGVQDGTRIATTATLGTLTFSGFPGGNNGRPITVTGGKDVAGNSALVFESSHNQTDIIFYSSTRQFRMEAVGTSITDQDSYTGVFVDFRRVQLSGFDPTFGQGPTLAITAPPDMVTAGQLTLSDVVTADPVLANAVWNNGNVLMLSGTTTPVFTGAVTSPEFIGPVKFPTSDPHIAGAWWNNTGVLVVSAG